MPGVEKGGGPEAWLSRRLWRVAAMDPVSRYISARADAHYALTARLSRGRARAHRTGQPPRLDARRPTPAAEGGARRRRSGGQLGRRLVRRRDCGDLAGLG